MIQMNGSARPAYKHYLVCLPPFDLTDRLETRQQTPVLLLSNLCCPLHVVASRILRSFEFDGQELLGCRVQSNYIPCSPPESFLILLFRYWRPPIRFLPRDFHFFISRCFRQLFFRAKLITSFLIPECAQPANELWLGSLVTPLLLLLRLLPGHGPALGARAEGAAVKTRRCRNPNG